MKKWIPCRNTEKTEKNRIAFKGGSYSLAITAIVLCILVVINILATTLPTALTKYDISSTQLYSITSNTKAIIDSLEDEVNIYWIVQSGEEDKIIENLLSKYDTLSEKIDVVKKNPDIYPTFAEQYTDKEVMNNSLVVECGKRSRFIGFDDIFISKADIATSSMDISFDGEGAITSAIDYVVNEEQPQLYVLEGHGESELPEAFKKQIVKENIELNQFSLLKTGKVPEDADCILIYAPSSDISVEEKNILAKYLENGGKMMTMAGPSDDSNLENLYSLLSDYGIEVADGVVIDPDREHYAFRAPYILMPEIVNTEITEPLINERYYAIMPLSRGLTIKNTGNAKVTELLTTSNEAFSRVSDDLASFEKEAIDIEGPFALAVSIETEKNGKITWFSSSDFLSDKFNAYSSGGNLDLTMNALSSMIGEREAVSIRSKSLNYNYLTIDESTSSFLQILMIGVFPSIYIIFGVCVIIKRRKQNETK